MRNLKILVIDDEADQASINTDVTGERNPINQLIINVVNGNNRHNQPTQGFGAMNYIAYTATPYANLLNESAEYSLYPRNFITALHTPKEYFGPQQIFGIPGGDYDGMNIVRYIPDNEANEIQATYSRNFQAANLPEAWKFLEYVACISLASLSGI